MTLTNIELFFIWAHRGRNRIAPENTMAAFRAALAAGDRGIELDVTLSRDGFPVVIHDDTVDRTTGGSGAVADLTLQELKRLDAGSWFGPGFSTEQLPLLGEVLNEFKGRLFVNIEIKASAWRENPDRGIETIVLNEIGLNVMGGSVLVSSFDWRILERIRRIDSEIPIGILVDFRQDPSRAAAAAEALAAWSIHPNVRDLIPEVPPAYRRFGGKLFPYTISDNTILSRLRDSGIDGCFADLPFPDQL